MRGRVLAVMVMLCIASNFIGIGEAQSPKPIVPTIVPPTIVAPVASAVPEQPIVGAPSLIKALDLTNMGDGQYVLDIKGAIITVSPLLLVQPGTPLPPDPPDPGDDLNARAKKFKAAAATVEEPKKDETQAVLSVLYNQLSQAILDNGLTDYQLISNLVRMSEARVLERQGSAEQWKPVTGLMSDELAKVAATSEVTAADYASCLVDAGDGLQTGENLDPMWIELIIQIILAILAALKP